MKKLMILVVFLTSCTGGYFADGYQFGDITLTLIDLEQRYCSEGNAERRKLLLQEYHRHSGDDNYVAWCDR